MAVTSGFFNAIDHDRLYNAEDVGSLLDGIISDGILNTYGSHFEVTHDVGLDIIVGSGRGWFKQTWVKNDDNITLTAEANVTGNVRYDTVVIDVNKTDAVRANTIIIVKGTSDPAGADLIDEAAHKQYPLANLVIDASGNDISDVVDRRDEIYSQNALMIKPYWPIGSIFMTLDINFDPAVSFGGVWEQISGKFLVGCGGTSGFEAGDTGGSWEHTITTNHLPSHNHGTGSLNIGSASANITTSRVRDALPGVTVMGWADPGNSYDSSGLVNHLPPSWDYPYGYQGSPSLDVKPGMGPSSRVVDQVSLSQSPHTHGISGSTGSTGNGTPIDIKPPYLAVFMWKRVS